MSVPEISLARSIQYGNYKQHRTSALLYIDILKNNIKYIKEFIKLPKRLSFVFRPIRGAEGLAYYVQYKYSPRDYIVEIDARQNLLSFKNTLLHELVHIEQFSQGRLKHAGTKYFKWLGREMLIDISSMDAYNQLPWEAEANSRAQSLHEIVFKELS